MVLIKFTESYQIPSINFRKMTQGSYTSLNMPPTASQQDIQIQTALRNGYLFHQITNVLSCNPHDDPCKTQICLKRSLLSMSQKNGRPEYSQQTIKDPINHVYSQDLQHGVSQDLVNQLPFYVRSKNNDDLKHIPAHWQQSQCTANPIEEQVRNGQQPLIIIQKSERTTQNQVRFNIPKKKIVCEEDSLLLEAAYSEISQILDCRKCQQCKNDQSISHERSKINETNSLLIKDKDGESFNEKYDNLIYIVKQQDNSFLRLLYPESRSILEENQTNLLQPSIANVIVNTSILNMDTQQQYEEEQQNGTELQSLDQKSSQKMINKICNEAMALIQIQQQSEVREFEEKLLRAKRHTHTRSISRYEHADKGLSKGFEINLPECEGSYQSAKQFLFQLNQTDKAYNPVTKQGQNIMNSVSNLLLNRFQKREASSDQTIKEVDSEYENSETPNQKGQNQGSSKSLQSIQNSRPNFEQDSAHRSTVKLNESKMVEEVSQQYQKIIGDLITSHQDSSEQLNAQFEALMHQKQEAFTRQKKYLNIQIVELRQNIQKMSLDKLEKSQQLQNWEAETKELTLKHEQDLEAMQRSYIRRIELLEIKLGQANEEIDRIIEEKDRIFEEKLAELVGESNTETESIRRETDQEINEIRKELLKKCEQYQELEEEVKKQYARFNREMQHKNQQIQEKEQKIKQLSSTQQQLQLEVAELRKYRTRLVRSSQIYNEESRSKDQLIHYLKFEMDARKSYLNNVLQIKFQAERQILILQETNRTLRNQILGYISKQSQEKEMYREMARLKVKLKSYQQSEKSTMFACKMYTNKMCARKMFASQHQRNPSFKNQEKRPNQQKRHQRQSTIIEVLSDLQTLNYITDRARSKDSQELQIQDTSRSMGGNIKIKNSYCGKQSVSTKKLQRKHTAKPDRQLQLQIEQELEQMRRQKGRYRERLYSPRQCIRESIQREDEMSPKKLQRWKSSENLGQALSKQGLSSKIWQKPQQQHNNDSEGQSTNAKNSGDKEINPAKYDLIPEGNRYNQFSILGQLKNQLSTSRDRSNSQGSFKEHQQ